MEFTYEDVKAAPGEQSASGERRIVTLELREGDTAWNPSGTKHPIYGPASVVYTQWLDGGYECTIVTDSGTVSQREV